MKGPVLALDLGTRRIGLAVSDPDATLAFPAGHLDRHSRQRDLEALQDLVRERHVSCIVVGLPIHMDGSRGRGAEAAKEFATALANLTSLRVELLDERWTTVEAERALRDAPRSRRRRKGTLDAMAATILLRTWLERAPTGGAGSES